MTALSKTKNIIPSINLHLPEDRERYRRELTWNEDLGTSCGSIRGTARLCEVSEAGIRWQLKAVKDSAKIAQEGAQLELPELAQRLAAKGFEGAQLVESWATTGIPAGAQHIMLEYYASKPSKRVAQMNLSYLSAGGLQVLNGLLLGQAAEEPVQLQLPPADSPIEVAVLEESSTAPANDLSEVYEALVVLRGRGLI